MANEREDGSRGQMGYGRNDDPERQAIQQESQQANAAKQDQKRERVDDFDAMPDDPTGAWFTERGTEEQIAALDAALAKAQGEMGEVVKSDQGRYGNQTFKFANLATLTKASRPALAKYGINLTQCMTNSPRAGGHHRLVTRLAGHGARLIWTVDFKPRGTIQDYGKFTTYLRRYEMQAVNVLDGDEDPDETGQVMPGPGRQRR